MKQKNILIMFNSDIDYTEDGFVCLIHKQDTLVAIDLLGEQIEY